MSIVGMYNTTVMTEKAIIAGSDTVHGRQFTLGGDGVPFHNGKPLTATKVGLSQFEIMRLSEKRDAGEEIKKAVEMNPKKFINLVTGVQLHAAAMIYGTVLRMSHTLQNGKYLSPRQLSPYQPEKISNLYDRVFWEENPDDLFPSHEIIRQLLRENRDQPLPPYFFTAYESFRRWQHAFAFEEKLEESTQALYGESGVLQPGVREKYWNWEVEKKKRRYPHPVAARVLSYWYSLQLQTSNNRFRDPLPDRTKALYETPMQLYTILDDGTAAMITWIQPDQVVLFDSGTIKYLDHKTPSELQKIPTYDDYDWLQIILSCIASWYLTSKFLETDSVDIVTKPPTHYVLFSQLRSQARLATAYFQFPEMYNQETGIQYRQKLELSDEQLERSLNLYEYLIRKYAVAENKSRFKQFKSQYDPEGKSILPKVLLDKLTTYQRLLLYSPLSESFVNDLSRLSNAELAEL